jgi:hydrogenase expression/formation protein HypC
MCDSKLQRVVELLDDAAVAARDLDGNVHRVSLLALDGAPPSPGEWLIVHSGYAIERVDDAQAELTRATLREAEVLTAMPAARIRTTEEMP